MSVLLFNFNSTDIILSNGPFTCDKCGFLFTTRKKFLTHDFSYHSAVKMFCDFCPRFFVFKYALEEHIQKDHLQLRIHKCKVCDFTSGMKGCLTRHMLQHGPKTECSICHKLISNMPAHLRIHIMAKCHICGKKLKKRSLLSHLRAIHKIKDLSGKVEDSNSV